MTEAAYGYRREIPDHKRLERPHMTQEFHESVQQILGRQGYYATAILLNEMNIPFEDAYELIFNRLPRIA